MTCTDEATRKLWGAAARGELRPQVPVHWLSSQIVLRTIVNPRISGSPEVGWLEWVQSRFVVRPARAGFVLGCGGGQLERRAAAVGFCRNFFGIDISTEAIEVARALASREGLNDFRYEAMDANDLKLEPQSL